VQFRLHPGVPEGIDEGVTNIGRDVEPEPFEDVLGGLGRLELLVGLPGQEVGVPGAVEHGLEVGSLPSEPGVLEEPGPGGKPTIT